MSDKGKKKKAEKPAKTGKRKKRDEDSESPTIKSDDEGESKESSKDGPISRSVFLKKAKALPITIGGEGAEAKAKEFSTGSFGWTLSKKQAVDVDGREVRVMVNLNITVIVHAVDDESGLDQIGETSHKKAKLETKELEQKTNNKPEVSIDLSPVLRKDIIVELDFYRNNYLTDINFLLAYPTLTSLNLRECWNLKDNYYPVSQLTNLRTLDISRIGLTTTEPLKTLGNLTSLHIDVPKNCMKHIVHLPSLKDLNLLVREGESRDRGDSELDQLSKLKSLEKLNLGGMFNDYGISDYVCPSLDFLSSLIGLTTLDLRYNDYLFYIKSFVNLPSLTDVDLRACNSIKDLKEISKLKSLVKLNLDMIKEGCILTIKKDLESLKELKNLKSLTLYSATYAPKFPEESNVVIHENESGIL